MLDKKVKDSDASIEILEDRAKMYEIAFFIFFIIGWSLSWGSVLLIPFKWDEIVMGCGICFLIFATWWLIIMFYYYILIKISKVMGSEK